MQVKNVLNFHTTQTWKSSSNGYTTFNDSTSSLSDCHENLAVSPRAPSPDVRSRLVKPKSLIERARMNVAWLDSSLSIMEQGIREYDTLCLRFKYYAFFDLNPKYDQVRINQLYEQAKWQLLNEEIDCTEEEMIMFGALQVNGLKILNARPILAGNFICPKKPYGYRLFYSV